MRAVRYHEYGGPAVLRIEDVPVPEPGPGQARIRVEAIGANAVDTKVRAGRGLRPWPLPGTVTRAVVGRARAAGPGAPGAGRRPVGRVVGGVVAAGPGAPVAVGDRVAGLAEDAHAEQVVVDARWLAPVPDDADPGEATALSMVLPLALRLLRFGRLAPGEAVLVQSA